MLMWPRKSVAAEQEVEEGSAGGKEGSHMGGSQAAVTWFMFSGRAKEGGGVQESA